MFFDKKSIAHVPYTSIFCLGMSVIGKNSFVLVFVMAITRWARTARRVAANTAPAMVRSVCAPKTGSGTDATDNVHVANTVNRSTSQLHDRQGTALQADARAMVTISARSVTWSAPAVPTASSLVSRQPVLQGHVRQAAAAVWVIG